MGLYGENCGKGGLARVTDMSSKRRWICGTLVILMMLTACQSAAQPTAAPKAEDAQPAAADAAAADIEENTKTDAPPENAQADAPSDEQGAEENAPEEDEPSEEDAPVVAQKSAAPEYALHLNFMGTVNGRFRPDEPLTRAECAQLLCNLTAHTKTEDDNGGYTYCPYYDLDSTEWYYDAVCAAAEYFPSNEWQFRPNDPITLRELIDALQNALGLTVGRWSVGLRDTYRALLSAAPEAQEGERQDAAECVYPTRAQTATLVCRALRRTPDTAAIRQTGRSLLLDVDEDRADYCDIVEAVVPHEYYAEESSETYASEALATRGFDAGIYLNGGTGYIVDASGFVLRGSGILEYGNGIYYRFDESGCIWADGALHPYGNEAVFARANGKLAADTTIGGYHFNRDGCYTCGDAALDALVKEIIDQITTDEMTQLEKLRACFDYVRSFKYLGRNAAYGREVKTFSESALLAFGEKILTTGKGDCYNFTAAFCLLARQLGYSAQTVVGECAYYWNWGGIAHGWVEIVINGQTWVFDPQIENYNLRTGLSNDYYGAFMVKYETASAYYMKH